MNDPQSSLTRQSPLDTSGHTNVQKIPAKRLFLPEVVCLQSSVSDAHATLLTSYDDARAHDDCVADLYEPYRPWGVPLLMLFQEEGEAIAFRADPLLARELRARGFKPRRDTDGLVAPLDPETLVDTLRWADAMGMALCADAWEILGDESRLPRPRQLAWDVDDPDYGDASQGAWATRLLDVEEMRALRAELREAIRCSEERAVHLTPLPDGCLRVRFEAMDYDLEPSLAQYDGCGTLVVKKEDWRLRVYRPSRDWITWGLQRALLEAWAEEMFGEGTPWHWG